MNDSSAPTAMTKMSRYHPDCLGRSLLRSAIVSGAITLLAGPRLLAQASHPTHETGAPFEVPAWAYPVIAPGTPAPATPLDSVTLAHVPRSRAAFTQARARERFDVVDWHPETHKAAPNVVVHGRKPGMMACGFCHLPDGMGRPENAMIAGLRADYSIAQVKEMKSHARGSASPVPFPPTVAMRLIADSVTHAELVEAARYFEKVRARRMTKVVESDSVPRTVAANGLYVKAPGGGVEPLGGRIIEFPVDLNRHELRDSRAEYVAYVPRGSVARGRALSAGDPRRGVKGCASCHGSQLRGDKLAPPLAGRFPSYLLRQLIAFRTGARATQTGAPMREVAATLSLDDMIAASAYAGSLEP